MLYRVAAVLPVLLGLSACADDAPADAPGPGDAAIDGDYVAPFDAGGTVDEMTCSEFAVLASRWFRRERPYIEPKISPRFFVDGTDFQALWGVSEPQNDGTTLIYAPRVYHFEDGTVQLGTAGRRGDPNSSQCVWVTPVRVEE